MSPDSATDSITHWFYTNAPAAWISAFLAGLTLLFVLWNRKKPLRIVIREIHNTALIRIWSGVRSQVSIAFQERSIRSLGQIVADIYNDGSDVVRNISFTLTFQENCTVLEASLVPLPQNSTCTIDSNKVIVGLAYLNPIREHKQVVQLSLLIDGKSENMMASGIGEGWSLKHLPAPTLVQLMKQHLMVLVPVVVLLLALIIIEQAVYGTSKIDNWFLMIYFISCVISLGAVGWSMRDVYLNMNRRL